MEPPLSAPLSPTLTETAAPPIMAVQGWLRGREFPADRPLLDLAQAAPADPPPEPIRQEIARAALSDASAHLYGPVLGDLALREEIAAQWSAAYGADLTSGNVAITAGCNQAFAAAVATVAEAGDAVMLPAPWYFSNKMWLDAAGIDTVALPTGDSCLPDPATAKALLTPNVKAIALISPNNPTGAVYPPDLLRRFLTLAQETGVALILDETYRDFLPADHRPHDLFDSGPDAHFIHLYSFSKVFRLTGHRVGAMIASERRVAEAEKFLDSITICPPRLGQIAALYGLRTMMDWVAGERAELDRRRLAVTEAFASLPDWRLLGAGAYFAYVRHPWDIPSAEIAQRLVADQSLLVLPGDMFGPTRAEGGDGFAEQTLRIAFANVDAAGIAEMARRLRAFAP